MPHIYITCIIFIIIIIVIIIIIIMWLLSPHSLFALPTTVIDHAYFPCQLHHLVNLEEADPISFLLPAILLCCAKVSPLWAQPSEACGEWRTLCMN